MSPENPDKGNRQSPSRGPPDLLTCMILTVIQIFFFPLFFLINFSAPKINHFMDDAILTIAMVISDCLLLQNVAFIKLMYFLHTCQMCTCTFFFWQMSIYSMWHYPTHWHKAKSLMLFNYRFCFVHTLLTFISEWKITSTYLKLFWLERQVLERHV